MTSIQKLVIAILVLSTVLLAEGKHGDEQKLTDAIQFKYNSGMTLGSFNGSTFAYKKMVSPEKEKRFSITINGNIYNQDEDEVTKINNFSPDTLYITDEVEDLSQKQFNLSLGYAKLTHRHNIERVSLFYGGGPILNYNYSSQSKDFTRTQDTLLYAQNQSVSNSNFSVGVQGMIGWEWRVSNIISITAEYGSTLRVKLLNASNESDREEPNDYISFNLIDVKRPTLELYGGTRIGVSLFF